MDEVDEYDCLTLPSRVAQNLMLAWYCCIEDVNNILEKVKICKTNFGGLLLFNLFFHFLLMQLLLKQ